MILDLRAETAPRLQNGEKLELAFLLLVPLIVNAIALLPELTIPVPSLNDDGLHYLFIQRASDALSSGQNVFDNWLPQIEAGFPQFFYYQHLPALAVVGLQRLSLGTLDLFTTFNLVRYVLLVAFPLTVLLSMRCLGFSWLMAVIAAAASSLLSSAFRYGFEYDSYIWRGLGVYTQLWAMHLSFLTVAAAYRAIHLGKRVWLAALLLGLLVLTHLLYAYMTAIVFGLLFVWGIRRSNVRERVLRLGVIGAFGAVISSYMWLPFAGGTAYLNATPYLQPEKYDSYGAEQILTWLFNGELLDHGRPPVLTILLAIGVFAVVLTRSRPALVSFAGFVVLLVVYFGRPTLGPLTKLFPLSDGLLFHRFLGGVDLFAIVIIGLGGAFVWTVIRPRRSLARMGLAFVAVMLILTPAILERRDFYAANTSFMQTAYRALQSDPDTATIVARLKALPPGRIFAGLPATWGKSAAMSYGDLKFYNLFWFNALDGFAPPSESLTLNADYIWDFRDTEPADYQLWNTRYVVAPTGQAVASFLSPILRTNRLTLYQVPTTGFAQYVEIASRVPVSTKPQLFDLNRTWERNAVPGETRTFIRYDYPASSLGPGPTSVPGCPDGGRTTFELYNPGKINLVVTCPAAATLIIKETFHPNWQVTVDGVAVPTFMVSPSYIGVALAAGTHAVNAVYQPTPVKTPLVVVGVLGIVVLLVLRGRLDRPGFPKRLRPRRSAAVDQVSNESVS